MKSTLQVLFIGALLCLWQNSLSQTDTSFLSRIAYKTQDWPIETSFSLDVRSGRRAVKPFVPQSEFIFNELRMQYGLTYYNDWSEANAVFDFGYDLHLDRAIDQFRALNIDLYPQLWWSLKIGRQALTWGKGDLVFINDLFPKDFRSFFIGRDIQYLKAPSDAIKLTLNPSWIQVNIVYTPQFDPDEYPTGRRITFFDEAFGFNRVKNRQILVDTPDDYFSDDELAWRIQKNVKGYDIALYGYYGFWKSPTGVNPLSETFLHPSLNVHGASVDGSILGGILALELGYYSSSDDKDGTDPLIRNDEWRALFNYTRDFTGNWSLGFQYYIEIMSDYDAYVDNLPGGRVLPQVQDMFTFRIRKLTHNQKFDWSLFSFFGRANRDFYIRPSISYKLYDELKFTLGANLFGGSEDYTFWNNFHSNMNVYFGFKFSFL